MLNELPALTLHHDVIPSTNSTSCQSETITPVNCFSMPPGQDYQQQMNGRKTQDFMSGLFNFILDYHRGIHCGARSKMINVVQISNTWSLCNESAKQRIAALQSICWAEMLQRANQNNSLKKSAETSVTGFIMSCIETNEFSSQREQNIAYSDINVNPASKLRGQRIRSGRTAKVTEKVSAGGRCLQFTKAFKCKLSSWCPNEGICTRIPGTYSRNRKLFVTERETRAQDQIPRLLPVCSELNVFSKSWNYLVRDTATVYITFTNRFKVKTLLWQFFIS